ncbi:hypothetical protein, partial [Actinotalea sp. C106]|uniref:hypothetical protein n=1 Tax=Actinotalea sp. C106 TaxID=2908644 RepID=UPI0020278BD2
MRNLPRVGVMLLGGFALLAGLDAALMLLGLPAPVAAERLPALHGGLLVLGFVGTLVAVERAVALRAPWAMGAPALLGLGALALVSPLPLSLGHALVVAGAAMLVLVYLGLWRRQGSPALAIQVWAAVLALGAALLWWAGAPVPVLVPWFAGFVVLTIVGERVELSRVGSITPGAERAVLLLASTTLVAIPVATLWPGATVALGLGLLAIVGWLVVHDVARRTVRGTGLPRFVAVNLLVGYAWLALAGALWALLGPITAGAAYDAVVHAVFLGFTLAMIMAHAPIILPAVLGRPLPYRWVMYLPAALLHVTLLIRVVGGDLHGSEVALQVGGAGNIASVLLFAVVAATSSALARPRSGPSRGPSG